MVNAAATSHSVTFSNVAFPDFAQAKTAVIIASEKNRILSAGKTSWESSRSIIKNAGAATSMLNTAHVQNACRQEAFLFVRLARERII
ncbi:hypothetical protein ABIC08_002774 [Bradyrhizobium sp. RT9b]|uniref:hypothetical protein n=1 Tax=unclassified Bradyrhizobium TaxID=2631580 RepID=UPI00339771CD